MATRIKRQVRRRRMSSAKENIKRTENFQYILIIEGIGVGFLVGLVVSLFRYAFIKAEAMRNFMVEASSQKILMALLSIGILVFLLVCTAFITKREPISGGSGIPQVEAELKGKLNARWLQVIIGKFLGGIMSVASGLSLGSEGPSVQLGAMVGKGFSRINQRLKTEEKMLLTCGSGAGLAAAFGAPLAGVVFTLEELHKNFSKEVLLCTMAAAITSDCVASYIFGLKPVFGFVVTDGLPMNRLWMVLILGVIMGAFGVFYNKTTFFMQDVFAKINPIVGRIIIPFVMIIAVAIWIPEALGSGALLIEPVGQGHFGVKMLIALLVVKYITSGLSFGTGLPGGTFLPLLVLGALTGGLFAEVVSPAVGYEESYIEYFVILGMAGYFSAIVRAPITGIILISEMTGTFSNLLALSMVSLVAYMVADILKGGPIYEQLTERLIAGGKVKNTNRRSKVLIESEVYHGSFAAEKTLSQADLPRGCLVVSIMRDRHEIVPSGETVLHAGDKLIILCNEGLVMEAQEALDKKCKTIYRN